MLLKAGHDLKMQQRRRRNEDRMKVNICKLKEKMVTTRKETGESVSNVYRIVLMARESVSVLVAYI